ncbi:DUF5385 family protein [Ureaplasma urealyticum]|uniref:Uncharacterized protein n=3 Tax=Ureaplasma urealyticum TaxID=2130 RepID=A0AAP9D7I2_UREUR|nr:DUF5385 family protein [Ureaplasma urealyticum]EDX53757.1 conserved hypothetical protein [Ureaplasma urealyticum serovar 9 str. ATCC 33175]ACI60015.1 conserved hypothetical protein [Ureaplasma urealyticum serovar 10 str. ATCC 33699]EDT49424.1 conserved hypothetical protein [Ureaplasma urealyticum serovar 13 str. ATCC 33698]EDU06227.1 conserved hypothetical protein [Ureaplasma urealyticum serovar 5 str. ATCC 27817]EDU57162.1 conserved hypothetical protein [Ureaplasma urealyticum serovar 7 st
MLDKQEIIESILQADATKGGNSNFLMILIIIIPIILVVVFIMRKKRKQNGENQANVNNKDKSDTNEVWATIKKYLRSIDDKGKEVIDSYVVKRAEPHNLAQMTKQQKIDYKNEQKAIKALKTTNPEQYKIEMERIKKEKRAKPKELYVVLFTTRNAKTLVVDEPRAIECEVRLVKVNKKENRREIDVVRALDYDEEMLWIEPIKAKDDEIYNKRLEADKKKQQKAAERRQKQLEKQKSKTK